MYLFIASLVLLASCNGAPAGDKMGPLPNLNFQPSFAQYSGYLQGAHKAHHLHYWYTASQNNPSTDPVVLWLSGGPGCSSVGGLLDELGPFKVHQYGKVVVENVYTWNKVANVIYLESPVGVGYSYTDDGNITTNDDITADDNHAALVDFFNNKFPELKGQDFYVTGESYAGVYVPTLAVRLIKDSINFPTFKGIAIGNPLVNYKLNVNGLIPLLYFHNLISQGMWAKLSSQCCNGIPSQCDYHGYLYQPNTPCGKLTSAAYMAPYNGLDPYNMYFSCYASSNVLLQNGGPRSIYHRVILRKLGLDIPETHQGDSEQGTTVPQCAHYNDTTVWMNLNATRAALNIPNSLPPWTDCNYALNENKYKTLYDDMTPFFQTIIGANKKALIYNGDVDSVCNAVSNQRFVQSLGHPLLKSKHNWNYTKEYPSTAGTHTQYQGIDFLTVRGSGHFVPTDKPREALQMLYNFMHNRPYSTPTGINTAPQPPIGGYCTSPVVGSGFFGGPYTASQLCSQGTCVNTETGAKCICNPGYTGPFCTQVNTKTPRAFVALCALYATPTTTGKNIPVGCPQLYTCVPYNRQCIASLSCTYPVGYCLPWVRLNSLNPKFRDSVLGQVKKPAAVSTPEL